MPQTHITISTSDAGANFRDAVRVGDHVEPRPPGVSQPWLTAAGGGAVAYDSVRVVNVRDSQRLDVQAYLGGRAVVGAPAPNTTYKIKRRFTRDQQIDRLVALAAAYRSNRVSLIWPHVALWHDGDGGLVDLGPQSIAACYAAAKSACPAQQGFTNNPFPGPHRIMYSNDYFNRGQLNRLSAAGWAVFVQDLPGGPIRCRHQVTSDGTEATIVQQIDKVSTDIKTILDPLWGVRNITQELLPEISQTVYHYLFEASSRKADRCGALIQGFEAPVLRARMDGQNLDLPPTTVECRVNVDLGHPFNNLELIIRGQ